MLLSRRAVSIFLGNSVIAAPLSFKFSTNAALSETKPNIESEFFRSYLERRYYIAAKLGRELFVNGLQKQEEEYNFNIYIDSLIYTADFDNAESAITQKRDYHKALATYEYSRVGAIIDVQMGDIYRTRTRWQEAEIAYKTAIKTIQKVFGSISNDFETGFSDLPQYFVRASNGLALIKLQQYQISQAKKLFRRSIQVAINRPNTLDKMIGHNDIPLATTYLHLGQGLLVAKEYDDAISITNDALDLVQGISGLSPAFSAEYLLIIAKSLAARGDREQAAKTFERAIAAGQTDSANFGMILVETLVEYYRFSKDSARADENLAEQALKFAEQLFGTSSIQAARCKLAILETSEDALAASQESDFDRLLEIFRRVYSEDSADIVMSKLLYAKHRAINRLPDEALKILETVRIEAAARFNNYTYVMSLIPESRETFSKTFLAAQMSKNSAAANAVMENMSRSIIADEYGKTLLRAYQGQKAVVELHLNNLSAFSANAKEQSDSKLEFQELTDAISREELKLRDLETELRKRHPEYFDFTRASNIEFEEARRLLSADEALVLIYSDDGRRGDYIWVITKEAERWLKLNTEPREIESSVSRLISQLTPNSSTTVDVTLAYELYQKTLGSLDNILEEKSHLIFVLDGPLASLPPHVFVTNDPTDQELKDVEWLIKRHAVTILPTVRTLSLLREDSIPSIPLKPMRAYADIIYSPDGERGNVVFDQRAIADVFTDGVADASLLAKASPLPATGPEVRSVMATLGGSNEDIVSGRAATELDVKQSNLLDYRVIYFATHGLLAAEVEELAKMRAEPALLLAVPQQASPQDDGLLTASEITQLKLNADWVVLSACNTAAGGKPGGAALSGLAQSFLHAGSRALLVSHWPVDDEATRTLMIKLFESYKVDGSIGAEALRSAMLGVMTDVDHPDWANPTYWAPFIIVGEPRTSTQ